MLASQYDCHRHNNMAQTRPSYFHIDSLTSFANMNVKNPYLVSDLVDMTVSQLAVSQSETRNFLNK